MGGGSGSMRTKAKPAPPGASATNGSGGGVGPRRADDFGDEWIGDGYGHPERESSREHDPLRAVIPHRALPSSPLQLSARSYACIMYRRDHGGSTSGEPDRARRMSRYRRYVGEVLPTTGGSEYGWSCVALRAWHPHKVPRAPAGPDHRLAEGITA